MKMWKKTMALVMAFGMTFAMAACGGDDDGGNGGVPGEDVKGEVAATQEDWNAAWEATLSATNFTMDFVKTYSEVGEGSHDWREMEEEGFIKVADGKQWSKYDYSEAWDYSEYEADDKGEETGVWEEYYGTIDGVAYRWFYEEDKWNKVESGEDDFATGAGVIEEMFEEFDYEELYEVATYDSSKGAYTYSWEATEYGEVFNNSIEIKIKDGKVVTGKKTTHCDDQGEGYEIDKVVACSITYGGVSITLPGEETEDGGDEESSNAGGEIGGGEVTGKPEQLTESEMEAAVQALYNAGNITVQGTHTLADGELSEYISQFADGKEYTEVLYQGYYSYSFAGEVDGAYYIWTTEDESDWGEAVPAEEANVPAGENPASISYLFEPIMNWVSYAYFQYDEVRGMHVFTNLSAPELEVKVVDGRIVEFSLTYSADIWQKGTITYGTATVGELPAV